MVLPGFKTFPVVKVKEPYKAKKVSQVGSFLILKRGDFGPKVACATGYLTIKTSLKSRLLESAF